MKKKSRKVTNFALKEETGRQKLQKYELSEEFDRETQLDESFYTFSEQDGDFFENKSNSLTDLKQQL